MYRGLKSRVKRLERKLEDNTPNGMSRGERRNFINEKAQAIENYLKCKPDEQDKALDEIYKINRKYRFEGKEELPDHLKHYLD